MPINSGKPERRNGSPARVKTNGSTGRMHGLRIVSTPPRNARMKRTMEAPQAGTNFIARPFMQYRDPVGFGPSLKT